jgi:hypothetical protein
VLGEEMAEIFVVVLHDIVRVSRSKNKTALDLHELFANSRVAF